MNEEQLSLHFERSELACHHCGFYNATPLLISSLEQLRNLGDESIIVHDACRCAAHNAAVGGVAHSEHPLGQAADIEIKGLTSQQMYDRAIQVPDFRTGGIGVYDHGNFIHVDVRVVRARWARVNGKYVAITELIKES
jgi:uncharacterized protein YcbK (DUF882 family)